MIITIQRYYSYWSIFSTSLFVLWTITYCKPLQQQSNDRLTIERDDRLAIDLDTIFKDRNGRDLEKLTRTIDALAQFRRTIDHRLLTSKRLEIIDDDEEEVEDYDGRPTGSRHNSRKHQRDHLNNRRAGVKSYQRDPQSNTYTMNGFNVKASLQESVPTVNNVHRRRDQPEPRYFTGGTSAMDEEQLRILSDLVQADFECPRLHDKTTQVLCPSRRRHGYRVCIPDTALCNDKIDCPNGEDEEPVNCLFYKTTIHHFRLVVDAVVQLSDSVREQERRRGMDEL